MDALNDESVVSSVSNFDEISAPSEAISHRSFFHQFWGPRNS